MLLFLQPDWIAVAKVYGPLGVGCVVAFIFVKVLLKYIQKQHMEHVEALKAAGEDARKERDYARQLREAEVNKFLESLERRDRKMEEGFDEIVRSLRK